MRWDAKMNGQRVQASVGHVPITPKPGQRMSEQNNIFTANLARLRLADAALADRVRSAQAKQLEWVTTRDGSLSASTVHDGRPLWLCSRYDPQAEADKLAGGVDYTKHACIVAMGLGLGHHVSKIAAKTDSTQFLLIVYEPDAAMLRAVMERIDLTDWIGRPNVIIADGETDRAGMLKHIEGFSGMLTQGTVLVTHPPTRKLHDESLTRFGQLIAEVTEFCRTNMATALVNASRTYRNLLMNLSHYAAGADTNELADAAEGRPAVCIGAGPSLAKNIHLLADPETRSRVVVIAVQTILKPLLDHGIRPDFVTALDYHEISTRFYDSLGELPDVTLVAQPLVNWAVPDRFPGPVRITNSQFLDMVLGEHTKPITPIRYGATVSHLAFYLAQHLGCDPIVLAGMDLGFSDGLYYFPGTAIHDVWAPELSPFNTLEMMEWQRIVRHRGLLKKLDDIDGQKIYTDEQMITYLKQFERDFASAPQRVIDATEGGLPKEHTERGTLAEALAKYATRPVGALPRASMSFDGRQLSAAVAMLKQRRGEVSELRRLSRDTIPLLRKMIKNQRDAARMDKLFAKLTATQKRVKELDTAFSMVNNLNSIGAFKRARADRAIENTSDDPYEHQRRQLERDIENVDWLIQACDEMLEIIHDALDRVERHKACAARTGEPGRAGKPSVGRAVQV